MYRFIQRWWYQQDQAVRELHRYIWKALTNFYHAGSGRAAALAYYTIFSVFPLSLLLTVVISKLLGPVAAQEQIANALGLFLPQDTVQLLKDNITEAMRQSSSFTLIALIGLIWSALGLFSNVTHALDAIFAVPQRRSLWRQRLTALIMTVFLVILVTASFVTSATLRLVSASLLGQPSVWLSIAIVFLPFGLNMVIFVLLFRYVPARYVHWDAIWPAAIVGAGGWELIKVGFIWYTASIANFQFIYGGIATAIVLLLWAYLLAAVFLLSAEICAQVNNWYLDVTHHHIIIDPDNGDTNT